MQFIPHWIWLLRKNDSWHWFYYQTVFLQPTFVTNGSSRSRSSDRLDLDQGSVNILNALDMAQAPFSGSSYNYLNVAETWSNIRKFNRFIKSLESSIVALKCLSSSVALDNTFKILQDDPIRYFLSSPLYPIFRLDNNANTWDSRDTLG